MMPYAESLETYAEWFAQLWAESLGKDELGQTPVRALGVTDQHSQLQLYRAGPRETLVTFVRSRDRRPADPETDVDDLSYLGDATLGELLEAEFAATEASLAAAGRPNIRLELERVDEYELGGLLYGMEAACVLAGELYEVNAFNQPAVEWAKRRRVDYSAAVSSRRPRRSPRRRSFASNGNRAVARRRRLETVIGSRR